MRIKNGGESPAIGGGNGAAHRFTLPHLFTQPLIDQHVRIDSHAYCQYYSGDARQRQGSTHQGEKRGEQHHVGDQHHIRDQAEDFVVDGHEHECRQHAEHHRVHALVDVVLTQARADRAFLDRRQRRRQTARAQQQGEFAALDGIDARDLEIVAEHAADGRAVDDLFGGAVDVDALRVLLARTVDEHHRHQMTDVLLRVLQHLRRAAAVEPDRDGGAFLGIRLERRIGELIAGHHHLAFQQHRLLVARVVQLGAQGHVSGRSGLERVAVLIDHAKLERRGLAEDFFDFGGILQTGQLDGDSIDALARHLGFRHREFGAVEAVAQNHDVLLHRVVLALLDLLRCQLQLEGRCAIDR